MSNFFDQQDQARRHTRYLIALFIGAVISTIACLYIGCLLYQMWVSDHSVPLLQPNLWLFISLTVGLIITIGSGLKMRSLQRKGGVAVMEGLDALPINRRRSTPELQTLQNVVEEMAIASGTAIPKLYILPSQRVNAVVAGFTPSEAVLGVSQGAMAQLTREELQSMVAHEFSCIVNGDMALNFQMLGLVHGLLVVNLLGRRLLPSFVSKQGGSRTYSSQPWHRKIGLNLNPEIKGGAIPKLVFSSLWLYMIGGPLLVIGILMLALGNGAIHVVGIFVAALGLLIMLCVLLIPIVTINLFALAVVLYLAGGIGWLSAQIVKGAVSRQRNFLADAAAVQFTRNPLGVAAALKRAAISRNAPEITSLESIVASHLFFCSPARTEPLIPALATHPPIAARIRRIEAMLPSLAASRGSFRAQKAAQNKKKSLAVSPQNTIAYVGAAKSEHIAVAHTLMAALPDYLLSAARSQIGAVAITYALLLNAEPDIRQSQKQVIAERSPKVYELLERIEPLMAQVGVRSRLPLLELCIPSLKTLKHTVAAQLFKRVRSLVSADKKLTLHEYALQAVLQYRLASHFRASKPNNAVYSDIANVWNECVIVIAALAHAGHIDPKSRDNAFFEGLSKLPSNAKQTLFNSAPTYALPEVGRALKVLKCTVPKLKQSIATACACTTLKDGKVTDSEAELLRAILITLGCPVPPFVDALG